MVIASFSIQDKLGRIQFFEETFILANTNIEVVLDMLFLAISNTDIWFDAESLTWKSYSATEILSIPRRVKLMEKREFTKVALDKNPKMIVVYITALKTLETAMAIQPS